jgi:geranylgeranyl diphosphate synthase type II
LIKALEKAKGNQKLDLEFWLNSKNFDRRKKVNAVTSIYNELKIDRLTEKKADQFFERGFSNLNGLSKNKKVNSLVEFTRDLIDRES